MPNDANSSFVSFVLLSLFFLNGLFKHNNRNSQHGIDLFEVYRFFLGRRHEWPSFLAALESHVVHEYHVSSRMQRK